jgi:hypothetical protein
MIALMGEEDDMKRRHHTPEQIVSKLREAARLLGERFTKVNDPVLGHQPFLMIARSLPSQIMSGLLISSSTKQQMPTS